MTAEEVVEIFLGSKFAMFLAVVVVAFILGYMCISDNCQLTLPANNLSKLISMVNAQDVLVCIKGSQWIKKTNFEICIGPERKSSMKTWLETLWPGSEREEIAVNYDPRPKEPRIESPKSSASTNYHRSPVEPEPKTSTSHVSRPKAWLRTLRDFVSPLLGKSLMGPKQDPKPERALTEYPLRPASEHSLRSVSSTQKSMKPGWLKSVSMNSLNEADSLQSGSWIEQPTNYELPVDRAQDQDIQNPEISRSSNGPVQMVEPTSMPVYGQHWNSFSMGSHSNPDRSRPKNCNKPIAITAVVCVTLTVLLMSGLFALLKANSDQLQQFGETLAQIYNRAF